MMQLCLCQRKSELFCIKLFLYALGCVFEGGGTFNTVQAGKDADGASGKQPERRLAAGHWFCPWRERAEYGKTISLDSQC
jgi:hypothetical protein